jgi:GNAT superfamily N-acetyltransferase
MPDELRRIPFTPELREHAKVRSFDCGTEPWETEIRDWLLAPPGQDGATDDVEIRNNPVWLYATDAGDLVGVASFGPASASYPKNSSPRLPATCITWLAVDRRHQRQGYGQRILEDVLAQAVALRDQFPLVTLRVHTGNTAALEWYRRNGFATIGKPSMFGSALYQRMVLLLTPPLPG